MAVTARNRRGNLRREPSDGIEDAEPSQAPLADSDDDEIEAPPPTKGSKSMKVKKEKKEKELTSEEVAEIEGDMLAQLGDPPIEKSSATKLVGMAEDWKAIRAIHGNSYALIRDVAATMAEFAEGDDDQEVLEELENTMRTLVDTENELLAQEQALDELRQKIARGEEVTNGISVYKDGAKRLKDEYMQKTSRQKYAKSDEYLSFRQAIFEVQHPNQPMPPLSEFIEREEGDDSDDEDDIVMGGVTQDYKCPISLTIMVDPLTAKSCGHSFSGQAIRDYLGPNRASRKKCPTSGCNKVLSLDDLKPNKELAKKAREAARRERMREEEDEDAGEEIVE